MFFRERPYVYCLISQTDNESFEAERLHNIFQEIPCKIKKKKSTLRKGIYCHYPLAFTNIVRDSKGTHVNEVFFQGSAQVHFTDDIIWSSKHQQHAYHLLLKHQ